MRATRHRTLAYVTTLMLTIVASGMDPAHAQESSGDSVSDLTGRIWELVQFQSSDGKTLIPIDKSRYQLVFQADGNIAVRVDCNRGRGTWKSAARNQLEFGPLALTKMGCPPAPLNQRIPQDWQYMRSYTMRGGHLFLALMADGGIYEFEPQASPTLENTYWKLIHLGNRPVTMASKQQEPHFALNSETRRVGGSGGCNRIMGGYELNGDSLTFKQMAGTMMACPEGMDTEKAFLQALSQATNWKITGQHLELYNAAGNTIASFEAVYTK